MLENFEEKPASDIAIAMLSSGPPRVVCFRVGWREQSFRPDGLSSGHGGHAVSKGMLFFPCLTHMRLNARSPLAGRAYGCMGAVVEDGISGGLSQKRTGGGLIAQAASWL